MVTALVYRVCWGVLRFWKNVGLEIIGYPIVYTIPYILLPFLLIPVKSMLKILDHFNKTIIVLGCYKQNQEVINK